MAHDSAAHFEISLSGCESVKVPAQKKALFLPFREYWQSFAQPTL